MSIHADDMVCPECGGPMVLRRNRTTNQDFMGCRSYPDCTGTRDVDGSERPPQVSDDDLPSSRARASDRRRWRE